MISKKIYFLALCLFISIISLAQDFDNYQPSRSQSPLPDGFLTTSTAKYKEAVLSDQAKNGTLSKSRHEFHLQTSFVLDELVKSGQLIFNDEMSKYVNKVLDNILKDNPELRKRIQVYMIRSASVNAFASDRAEIFVNVGLLANINNEAELAFILCHEVQHIIHKHNLQTFIEFDDFGNVQQKKNYDKIVEKHSYEKDLEREADKKGLELFLKSGYSVKAAEGVFDVLSLTHVPYANDSFKISYFENDYIKFLDYTPIKEINKIKPIENDDDKHSTHPSLKERRKAFQESTRENGAQGVLFMQPKSKFEHVQKIARFDLCDILVANRTYGAALYHSFLLLNRFPENSYAEKNIAKSLYGYAQYINRLKYKNESTDIDDDKIYNLEGQMQLVLHFLDRLTQKELNVLAGRYCWELSKKYPNDLALQLMARDMIEDIVIFPVEKPEEFFKTEVMPNEGFISFAPYGFGDLMQDSLFLKWLENGKYYRKDLEKRYEENEKLSYKDYYNKSRKERRAIRRANKTKRKADNKKKKEGVYLGIDRALFVNPMYLQVKINNGEDKLELKKAEVRQLKMKQWIEDFGNDLGMETVVLDGKQLNDTSNIAAYNDMATIDRWVTELLSNDMYMISSNYNDVRSVLKKYNTSTIVYTGAFSVNFVKEYGLMSLYTNLIFALTPFMPLITSATLTQFHQSMYFTLVFDFNKNTIVHRDFNTMVYQKGSETAVKSNLYWAMLQMKRVKPTEKSKK